MDNYFEKINFVFQNTKTHLDKVGLCDQFLTIIRPYLNEKFRDREIRQDLLEKIILNDYIIKIFFTDKEPSNPNGLACLSITNSGEVIMGCYLKRYEKYKKIQIRILYSLIHEITHLFIEKEEENLVFSKQIFNEILSDVLKLKKTNRIEDQQEKEV